MYTISEMCRTSGLSRSTLLYYDSIGLLRPTERSTANYRKYSEQDRLRLQRICRYREAGIPLLEMKRLLADEDRNRAGGDALSLIMEKRLEEIQTETRKLRLQQQMIAAMLRQRTEGTGYGRQEDPWNQKRFEELRFVELLKECGLTAEMMRMLHEGMEEASPEGHQQFLEFLGFNDEEIRQMRRGYSASKKGNEDG